MKKFLISTLSIILICILYCTPVFASSSYSDCSHIGNTVKALENGDTNIAFDDGYNGFCICWGDENAETGDEFQVANMEIVVNNKNNENVSEHLKVLFTQYFDRFFKFDVDSGKYIVNDKVALQHTIWHFSDGFNGWRVDRTLIDNINQTVKDQTSSIPDHGYILKIDDTTSVMFDFHALKAPIETHQNFWCYKLTIIHPPQITAPTEAQLIEVATGASANLSVTASNAETYQWQVDNGDGNGFVNIPDATNASYATPSITTENESYKYRCIVINPAGSAESPVFTLKQISVPQPPASDSQQPTQPANRTSVPATGDITCVGWYGIIMLMSMVLIAVIFGKRFYNK